MKQPWPRQVVRRRVERAPGTYGDNLRLAEVDARLVRFDTDNPCYVRGSVTGSSASTPRAAEPARSTPIGTEVMPFSGG